MKSISLLFFSRLVRGLFLRYQPTGQPATGLRAVCIAFGLGLAALSAQAQNTNITVSGFSDPNANGTYTLSGGSNVCSQNYQKGSSFYLRFDQFENSWKFYNSTFTVTLARVSGTRTNLPCNGWEEWTPGSGTPRLSGGCGTIQLVPFSRQSVSIQPRSQTITTGNSATLTASGATSYTWSNGSTVNPLVISSVTSTSAFSVTGITDACAGTATASISVTGGPGSGILLDVRNVNPLTIGPGNCPGRTTFMGWGLRFEITGPGGFVSNLPFRTPVINRTMSITNIRQTGQYRVCAYGNLGQTPVCQTFTVGGQSCP